MWSLEGHFNVGYIYSAALEAATVGLVSGAVLGTNLIVEPQVLYPVST